VGWVAGPTIHRELVLNAVLSAVRRRQPGGTLIHSDQGTQYGGDAWRRFCRSNHLEPSMSRKGNCWDNAVAESFFSSLKKERINKQIYKNRELAIADVAHYIDSFYNPTRHHGHLGGVSPEQFEAAHKPLRKGLTESWELQESVRGGCNTAPWQGVQGTASPNGFLGGNSVGTPGVSATATYGFCW
jgi:putative transposase